MMDMSRNLIFILNLFVLLSTLSIKTAFGEMVSLGPTHVSYTVFNSVSYDGPVGQISFDVNVTLECETIYNGSVYGEIPPPSETEPATCLIDVAPYSGTLTTDYHINRPTQPDLDGSKSIPLPLGGQELLGGSPPISIPIVVDTIPIGTITIVIHGYLFGHLSLNSTFYTLLEWSTWETKEFNITSNAPIVLLTLETRYGVAFTVTVSVNSFDVVSVDSPMEEVEGSPSVEYVIPEFPSDLILPLFIIVSLIAVILRKRKAS